MKNEINIEVEDKVASGVYSNIIAVSHTDAEFVLDFASMLPGFSKARVQSRVLLSPIHARHLMNILQTQLAQYDSEQQPISEKDMLGEQPRFPNAGEA